MVLDSITDLLASDFADKKRLHKAIKILQRPQNILKKKLIIKTTGGSGKKVVFQSFRVQHNDARGPFMGGVAFLKGLTEENCKQLSFLESIKLSIADLSFGGAFGGIDINKNKISNKDLQRLTKIYSQFLTSHLGVWRDIVSTNIGTDNQILTWMMDAYEKKKKFHSPAAFVSNSFHLDGATVLLNEYLKNSNFFSRFRKLDIAIVGFGERATKFALNLNMQNFRIVAVSDTSGGIVNSNGFDIGEIINLKNKFSTLKEVSVMQNKEYISKEKILDLPVDILVIASAPNCILKDNAENIQAKLVLELANFGINKEAYEILANKKIEVLPDVLLNLGFSVLYYLDGIQKTHGYKWGREEISKKLNTSITKIFLEIKNIVEEKKITYRQAGYYIGSKRIIEAMMLRGRV